MGYVILCTVLIVFFLILGIALANASSGFGAQEEEERRKDDEAQIEYLKKWKQQKKRKHS